MISPTAYTFIIDQVYIYLFLSILIRVLYTTFLGFWTYPEERNGAYFVFLLGTYHTLCLYIDFGVWTKNRGVC